MALLGVAVLGVVASTATTALADRHGGGWHSGHHGGWHGRSSWGISLGFGGYWPYSGWGGWYGYDRYYLRPYSISPAYYSYPPVTYTYSSPAVVAAPAQVPAPSNPAPPPAAAPAPASAMSSANSLFGR